MVAYKNIIKLSKRTRTDSNEYTNLIGINNINDLINNGNVDEICTFNKEEIFNHLVTINDSRIHDFYNNHEKLFMELILIKQNLQNLFSNEQNDLIIKIFDYYEKNYSKIYGETLSNFITYMYNFVYNKNNYDDAGNYDDVEFLRNIYENYDKILQIENIFELFTFNMTDKIYKVIHNNNYFNNYYIEQILNYFYKRDYSYLDCTKMDKNNNDNITFIKYIQNNECIIKKLLTINEFKCENNYDEIMNYYEFICTLLNNEYGFTYECMLMYVFLNDIYCNDDDDNYYNDFNKLFNFIINKGHKLSLELTNNLLELFYNRIIYQNSSDFSYNDEIILYDNEFRCTNNILKIISNSLTEISYKYLALILYHFISNSIYDSNKLFKYINEKNLNYNDIFTYDNMCNILNITGKIRKDFFEILDENNIKHEYDRLMEYADNH